MNFILPESFKGPALYFSMQALLECKRNFLSERHIEMIYATLVAWGMHRSGKGGAKMPDYYEFKKSILNNRERLYKLKDKRIEHLNGNVFKVVQNELEDLCFNVNGICASKTKSKVVSASKTLAHILPNLVPPIDREYTARFFNYNSGNFTPKKEKELFKKVMQTLFSTYQDKFVVFCAQRFIDFHYRNTISLPKLFDYFIVEATTQKNLSKSCAFSTLREMMICRGMNCWAHKTFIRFNTPLCILKRRNSLMTISSALGTRLQRHRHRDARICPRGRARARGVHPRVHELGVGCSPEILPAPIARATLRQPRGQRPIGDAPWHVSTRRHLLPAAVLRGGGGGCGGEMVMEPLVPPF